MTNREHLNQISDDEYAKFLYMQIYPDDAYMDIIRYHTIRNFLKNEYTPQEKGKKDEV